MFVEYYIANEIIHNFYHFCRTKDNDVVFPDILTAHDQQWKVIDGVAFESEGVATRRWIDLVGRSCVPPGSNSRSNEVFLSPMCKVTVN